MNAASHALPFVASLLFVTAGDPIVMFAIHNGSRYFRCAYCLIDSHIRTAAAALIVSLVADNASPTPLTHIDRAH